MADVHETENSVLERIVRLKSECLAKLAHDARNAVSMLQGADRLASSRGDATFLRQALEKAQRQFHETARSVENLLDVSALMRGSLPLDLQSTDLVELTEKVARATAPQVEERHQTLTLDVPQSPVYAVVDPVRLERLLINLVTMVSRETGPDESLIVVVMSRDEIATIKVSSESGRFASPVTIEEYLLSVDAATDKTYDALELGASLSKAIAHALGGTIEAVDDGKSLSIQLPVR